MHRYVCNIKSSSSKRGLRGPSKLEARAYNTGGPGLQRWRSGPTTLEAQAYNAEARAYNAEARAYNAGGPDLQRWRPGPTTLEAWAYNTGSIYKDKAIRSGKVIQWLGPQPL